MPSNKFIAVVEKIVRSKIWLVVDGRKFYLPVELWPNTKIGEKIKLHSENQNPENNARRMLEEIIN
jgi:hypothetical protein